MVPAGSPLLQLLALVVRVVGERKVRADGSRRFPLLLLAFMSCHVMSCHEDFRTTPVIYRGKFNYLTHKNTQNLKVSHCQKHFIIYVEPYTICIQTKTV